MKISYEWCMPDKWTFRMKPIKSFIEKELFKHKKILIPFAGMTRWKNHSRIIYIDIEENRPKPYILGDCKEIMLGMIEHKQKYDLIISDPPFTYFQTINTYNNQKMQDITYCKNLYNRLLKPGGIIIHCGFNSSGMGIKRGYNKLELLIVNCGGSHNDYLILKEKKMIKTLI